MTPGQDESRPWSKVDIRAMSASHALEGGSSHNSETVWWKSPGAMWRHKNAKLEQKHHRNDWSMPEVVVLVEVDSTSPGRGCHQFICLRKWERLSLTVDLNQGNSGSWWQSWREGWCSIASMIFFCRCPSQRIVSMTSRITGFCRQVLIRKLCSDTWIVVTMNHDQFETHACSKHVDHTSNQISTPGLSLKKILILKIT